MANERNDIEIPPVTVEDFCRQAEEAWGRRRQADSEFSDADYDCEDIVRRAYATLAPVDFEEFGDRFGTEHFDEWLAYPEDWIDNYKDLTTPPPTPPATPPKCLEPED